jgi:acyl-CoA synthetase (AMP-forming)/AMP-acid ligase II
MVQMQYFYGDKMILRALDETEFWKLQEAEHTIVIREIVPDLEDEYVKQLENYEQIFSQARAAAVKYMEAALRSGLTAGSQLEQQIMQFLNICIRQSRDFIAFLNTISTQSEAVGDNPAATTVVDHIRRESEYYVEIITAVMQFEQRV